MASKPIDPENLSPAQISQAIEQLPQGMSKVISGVAKHPEPITESQSPEEVRKANLRALKARRRDLVASLVELDIEIFKAEDTEYNSGLTPETIRAWVIASLKMAAQVSMNFSIMELIESNPHEGITYATWVSELQSMHRERKIFLAGDKIILTGLVPK